MSTTKLYHLPHLWELCCLQAWMALYGAVIALVLLLWTMGLVSCPGGLLVLICGLSFLNILLLAQAVALAGGMVALNDGCTNLEAVVTTEVRHDCVIGKITMSARRTVMHTHINLQQFNV